MGRRGKWVVVGAVVAVAAGGGGAWVWARDDGPSAPPDGPWPMAASVQITLCTKDAIDDLCDKKHPASEVERQAVLAKLRTLPGITDARITAQVKGMPDDAWVKATVASRDNFPQVKAIISGLPGVGKVTGWARGYWIGKSDLGITLCPRRAPRITGSPCDGRGPATRAEKDAVYQRLRELPEVAEVYLADWDFAVKVARHNQRGGLSGVSEQDTANPAEEFHVKLAGTANPGTGESFARQQAAADRIRELVEPLPGVWSAPWGSL